MSRTLILHRLDTDEEFHLSEHFEIGRGDAPFGQWFSETRDESELFAFLGTRISLMDDNDKIKSVSRNHLAVKREFDSYFVCDDSTYGTRVNQVRLTKGERRPLEKGDQIQLADSSVMFEVDFRNARHYALLVGSGKGDHENQELFHLKGALEIKGYFTKTVLGQAIDSKKVHGAIRKLEALLTEEEQFVCSFLDKGMTQLSNSLYDWISELRSHDKAIIIEASDPFVFVDPNYRQHIPKHTTVLSRVPERKKADGRLHRAFKRYVDHHEGPFSVETFYDGTQASDVNLHDSLYLLGHDSSIRRTYQQGPRITTLFSGLR